MADQHYWDQLSHSELLAELASLDRRLRDGEARIEAAIANGDQVAAWEEFWIKLLHEYEALHDRISSAHAESNLLAA